MLLKDPITRLVKPGMVAFDIGANCGQTAQVLSDGFDRRQRGLNKLAVLHRGAEFFNKDVRRHSKIRGVEQHIVDAGQKPDPRGWIRSACRALLTPWKSMPVLVKFTSGSLQAQRCA